MDIYTLPDKAIQKELGNRFRALRLRRNSTQKELSEATTLSLNVIKALESGNGKLSSIIAVLRELQALDQLHDFIPEPEVSPLQIVKMRGKTRKRATGSRGRKEQASESSGEQRENGDEETSVDVAEPRLEASDPAAAGTGEIVTDEAESAEDDTNPAEIIAGISEGSEKQKSVEPTPDTHARKKSNKDKKQKDKDDQQEFGW